MRIEKPHFDAQAPTVPRPPRRHLWLDGLKWIHPNSLSGEITFHRLYTDNEFEVPILTHAVQRDIDPLFVSSYNNPMKIMSAGFFRPDHDPPQSDFLGFVSLKLFIY
jgi:hypothetical protein